MTFFETLQEATARERDSLLSAPIIQRCLQGEMTLNEYVAFLSQAYHHVKHTTPLLMATGARLPEKKEWLRNAVAEYIEEELGHQEWILNDIAACGFDKEAVRASTPTFATEMMVAYAYDTVNRINPLGFFGMVLVLEGTSTSLATRAADIIQQKLHLPNAAFTYLRSHGVLDISHVAFYEALMNRIDDAESQHAVVHAAKCFYTLYGNIFRTLDQIDTSAFALQEPL